MTIHTINSDDVYLYLIKANIDLIFKLTDQKPKEIVGFDPSDPGTTLYEPRARHLQSMAILGLTYEHLLKRIIIKRKYSVFEVNNIWYQKQSPQVNFSNKTISFSKLIKIFLDTNPNTYFAELSPYEFNTENINYQYEYLGYKRIDPSKFINLIQKIRNNYVHDIDSHSEWNGIMWYTVDYLIWLAKKEFPIFFKDYNFIGNPDIQSLFKKD